MQPLLPRPLSPPTRERARAALPAAVGLVVLLAAVGGLVTYKAGAALRTLAGVQASHTLAPKAEWIPVAGVEAWLRPLAGALNGFAWIAIALTYGVVIGAVVKALLPQRWLVRALGGSRAGPLVGAAAGVPLMLCSCCAVPVFEGVYSRTRRLGPALALLVASPALNPAALALTFLLFPARLALGRLALALLLVLAVGLLVPRAARLPAALGVEADDELRGPLLARLGRALGETLWRSLPPLALGLVLSALVLQGAPLASLSWDGAAGVGAVLLVALLAALVALPTFGELPLALALQLAGAPPAAVLAVLVAGPAINLPSLLGLWRTASARTAWVTGLTAFLVSGLGALALA